MSDWKNYSCIAFSGLALHPSFLIYLIEIRRGRECFFYVGMTGDSHYPSARSILHRLAGHIDLGKRSTQSQFIKGLREQVFQNKETLTEADWASLDIKLHYWPISGFEPWKGSLRTLNKQTEEYQKYKEIQTQVMALEQKIIGDFRHRLLNKGKGKPELVVAPQFSGIYEDIKNRIGNE